LESNQLITSGRKPFSKVELGLIEICPNIIIGEKIEIYLIGENYRPQCALFVHKK